jgi:hypothetical protein
MFDLFGGLSGLLSTLYSWAKSAVHWLADHLHSFIGALVSHLGVIGHLLRAIPSAIVRGLKALRHFNWHGLWGKLQSWYKAYQRWTKKVHDLFFGPLDTLRKIINSIYDTFFRPLITIIDNARRLVQIIGIFDRKLAAQLDQKLWALEGKLLYPITALTQRVNRMSSYFSSIITTLGLLDRPLLLESIRRDCSQIWHVLLNPLDRKPKPVTAAQPRTDVQVQDSYRQYLKTGTGDYAAPITHAQDVYAQTLKDLT